MTSSPRQAFLKSLNFALELGFTIIVPLVLFALGGRLLDRKFGTSPWFFLGGTLLSIVLTVLLLIRKIKSILKDLEDSTPTKPSSSQ